MGAPPKKLQEFTKVFGFNIRGITFSGEEPLEPISANGTVLVTGNIGNPIAFVISIVYIDGKVLVRIQETYTSKAF